MLGAAASAIGCQAERITSTRPVPVRLHIDSRVTTGNAARVERATVVVAVHYLRGTGQNASPAPTALGTAQLPVDGEPGEVVTLPIEFDLAPCLNDSARASTTDVCPVVISLALRVGTITVDSVQLGPISVGVGSAVTVPQLVELRVVSRLQLSWHGQTRPDADSLSVGDTLRLTATPLDAVGSPLTVRPVVWSSAAPNVATVNTTTGLVTAVAPGTTAISAIGGGRLATFTAHVRVPLPTVTVVAADPAASEVGPNAGVFRVARSIASTTPLAVAVTLTGTAVNGTDYQTLSTTQTIAANATFVDVVVVPIADALSEAAETVVLTVAPGAGYAVGGGGSATVSISDAATTVRLDTTEVLFNFDLTSATPAPPYLSITFSAIFAASDPISGTDRLITNVYGGANGTQLLQVREDTNTPSLFSAGGTQYGPLVTANPLFAPMLDGVFSYGLRMPLGTANLVSFTACGNPQLPAQPVCVTLTR
jgi:hypothetical protein